ncbi:type VI secretion system baseplate subunit TssG [Duganella sp. Dugasp56]|uniref:type VI secretion system baseplate subunit TssG n=1 Tax=Duganella sp. Dugasp56 TaxID=3243046 RepID=UPI0039AEEA64
MPASQRRTDAGLIGELLAEPQQFEFFQAVRLVEQAQPTRRLRYRNRLSLAFPPNQIENISDDGDDLIRLTPAFMGLLGSHGVLPLHYSERINRHERTSNDGGPRAFLDVLSHRPLAMFYLAWAKHRPECMTTPDGDDGFLAMLLALSGAEPDGTVDRETLARYAMQIRSRSVSAPLLAGIYSEYFNVRFVVEQLIGQWQLLAAGHQAQLGKANVDLGAGVMLGERIYGCDARVRLRIGPLNKEAYEGFLPGCGAARQLESMLGLHCGIGMTYEVRLIQRADDVCAPRLDGERRLGVNACLVGGPQRQDREELMYLLHT